MPNAFLKDAAWLDRQEVRLAFQPALQLGQSRVSALEDIATPTMCPMRTGGPLRFIAMRLDEAVPDIDVLLAMAPRELAPHVLRSATPLGAPLHAFAVQSIVEPQPTMGGRFPWHPRLFGGQRSAEVERAVREAVQWLASQVLVMPRDGSWYDVTRQGVELLQHSKFEAFLQAAAFPKVLLHPSIADKVWLSLARGDLEEAVLSSFKAVEEAVRAAAGYGPEKYGTQMMREAFNPSVGPLSRGETAAEKEALSSLFAGAIGYFKNPPSHRTVLISDRGEAQEQVILASHLLRIVDSYPPLS